MTWPEYFGAVAILCFLAGFGAYVWEDLARQRRAARSRYVRDWHLASSRPYDRTDWELARLAPHRDSAVWDTIEADPDQMLYEEPA